MNKKQPGHIILCKANIPGAITGNWWQCSFKDNEYVKNFFSADGLNWVSPNGEPIIRIYHDHCCYSFACRLGVTMMHVDDAKKHLDAETYAAISCFVTHDDSHGGIPYETKSAIWQWIEQQDETQVPSAFESPSFQPSGYDFPNLLRFLHVIAHRLHLQLVKAEEQIEENDTVLKQHGEIIKLMGPRVEQFEQEHVRTRTMMFGRETEMLKAMEAYENKIRAIVKSELDSIAQKDAENVAKEMELVPKNEPSSIYENLQKLHWFCKDCFAISYVEDGYELDDSEPCVYCVHGTAWVYRLASILQWLQVKGEKK